MAKTKVKIQNPDAPMTDKQTYKLYMITGVTMYYMSEYPYTIQEASDLIDRAMNGEAYHVRVETAQHEGSKVSWTDVGKQYREDTKPKGYKSAMEMLTDTPAEEEDEELDDQEPVDELTMLRARVAELEKKPAPQKQGLTKAQKRAALQKKAERDLKASDKPKSAPQQSKKKKSAPQSSDNGKPSPEEANEILYAMLAKSSGISEDKIKRMAAAFSS